MSSGTTNNSPSAHLTTHTFEIVSVDSNGETIDRQPGAASCMTESLSEGIDLDLVLIPSGTFMMGDHRHHQDEQPIHQVTVPSFYIGKYPITQAQYRFVMGEERGDAVGIDYPIEKINWHDAIDFCHKLSQQTGKHYSLPSEAQWEYACRAGTTTTFHFGDTITPDLANYNGDYPYGGAAQGENRAQATPVGSFPANAFGLYDMHGNVWEWCLDEYQPSYQGAPIDGSAVAADLTDGVKRVMRGGAWDYVARGCRSAVRCSLDAGLRVGGCGLRVVVQD
ncbi:formylglycine-generating enzyme family protein [Chamaesiphon sp.]|uniref:formylglycine-generating enzyme family protein n=1 Tax=Chamaesiphon sp. TaxID=2814140 RepID=UPI0035933D92